MKIDVNMIPPEGLTLDEEFKPGDLDLETDIIRFRGPIKAKAEVSRIANAVTINLNLDAAMETTCSRCLKDFKIDFTKNIDLNYLADKSAPTIDLDPDIREEIILEYPIKPLCKSDCKGLCPKCGQNLNEGGCSCGTT